MARLYTIRDQNSWLFYHGIGFTKKNPNPKSTKLSPTIILRGDRMFYDINQLNRVIRETIDSGLTKELYHMRVECFETREPELVSDNLKLQTLVNRHEAEAILEKLKGTA